MTTLNDWVAGARPRTLWTAVSAVAVGTGAAASTTQVRPSLALLALGVAIALQIASNYANDYADGVRGTDLNRIGPERLVASGKAAPSAVKRAAYLSFAAAAVFGLGLVAASGTWWLLAVGALAIVAAWTYTASDRPYGYEGWGEVAVLIFFGPVAVLGTQYTQAGTITWWSVVASIAVGLWAVAMLMVNNIRDIDGDALAGKRTLAVKLGDRRARALFATVVLAPLALTVLMAFARPWALIATITALPAFLIAIAVRAGARGVALAPVFKGVSAVGLGYGLLLAVGLAI